MERVEFDLVDVNKNAGIITYRNRSTGERIYAPSVWENKPRKTQIEFLMFLIRKSQCMEGEYYLMGRDDLSRRERKALDSYQRKLKQLLKEEESGNH